jgi:predicted peptidase
MAGMLCLLAALAMQAPPAPVVRPGELAPLSFRRRLTRTLSGSYLLYLPTDYGKTAHERWPVILFLHGSGESGESLSDLRKHGPPKEVAAGRQLPFIIVAPQSPQENGWDPYVLTALLNEVEAKYRVDRDREYVTGLSMGGDGTYTLAALTPERFAAVVPISAQCDRRLAPQLKRVSIWAIHGSRDNVVPVRQEQPLIDALQKLGADVTYTVVDGGGHDVWTPYYAGDELYEWLLKHKRRPRVRA